MKRHGFIAVIFLIGCATGGVASQFVVPPARAGTNPTRWEYLCKAQVAGNPSATEFSSWGWTTELNRWGAEGWELVSVTPRPSSGFGGFVTTHDFILCSKRALP
jgi:hypothetical protein